MAMKLSDFIDEVRANIKRSSDAVSDERVARWVNWGQSLIADWHTFEEMRHIYTGATTAGCKKYGFPPNMKDIYSLVLQDGASSRKLIYVFPREFDLKVPYPEQTTEGRPSYYVDYGVNFEVYRIPDKEYVLQLRCSCYPSDLVNDDDESELLRKDALIVACATMFGFLSLREVEDATYWKNEVVTPLFQAALLSDHSGEDWTPIARGFDTKMERLGVYWSNPLVKSVPGV